MAAAKVSREHNQLTRVPSGTPIVFAVRLDPARALFGWEIRRFGGVIVRRSTRGYRTTVDALQAGRDALGPECAHHGRGAVRDADDRVRA